MLERSRVDGAEGLQVDDRISLFISPGGRFAIIKDPNSTIRITALTSSYIGFEDNIRITEV